MLIVNNLTKYYGADLILKNVSFSVGEKDHLVVVGNNGAGKTTLLKAIGGQIDYEGSIELVGGFKNIGWLKQEVDNKYLDNTVFEFIENGRNLKIIEQKIADCYERLSQKSLNEKEERILFNKIEELQNMFEQQGGYTAEADIVKLAKGCGIDDLLVHHL